MKPQRQNHIFGPVPSRRLGRSLGGGQDEKTLKRERNTNPALNRIIAERFHL